MSDETPIDAELESFAKKLSQSKLPSANIDRDQLMYDAGWAAAKASLESSTTSASSATAATTSRNGFLTSIAVSFCSGVAAAAAIMVTMFPGENNTSIRVASNDEVKVIESVDSTELNRAFPSADTLTEGEDDLLAWIDNLPQGHTVSANFSSKVSPFDFDDPDSLATSSRARPPRTSRRMMRELIPTTQTRQTIPAWTAWLGTGF